MEKVDARPMLEEVADQKEHPQDAVQQDGEDDPGYRADHPVEYDRERGGGQLQKLEEPIAQEVAAGESKGEADQGSPQGAPRRKYRELVAEAVTFLGPSS